MLHVIPKRVICVNTTELIRTYALTTSPLLQHVHALKKEFKQQMKTAVGNVKTFIWQIKLQTWIKKKVFWSFFPNPRVLRFSSQTLFWANQCGQMGPCTPKASVSPHFQSTSRCLLPIAHINQSQALFTAKVLIVREGIKWYLSTSTDAKRVLCMSWRQSCLELHVLVQLPAHNATHFRTH